MEGTVRLVCPRCDTSMIVMSPEVYGAIGGLFGGLEAETEFKAWLADQKARTGDRLAVADVERVYTCPECGQRGQLPPSEELFTD